MSGIDKAKQASETAKSRLTKLQGADLTSFTPQRAAMIGGTILAILFAGMFAMQIISGILALAVTAAFLLGGFYLVRTVKNLDPFIREKIRNESLKMLMEEVKKNSLAHLMNQVLENTKKMVKANASVNKIGAMVKGLEDSLANADKTRDSHAKKEKMYNTVSSAYSDIQTFYANALAQNKQFEEKVEEHRSLQKFTDGAQDVLALMNTLTGKDIDEMLDIEAFESIGDEFNASIVAIENGTRNLR